MHPFTCYPYIYGCGQTLRKLPRVWFVIAVSMSTRVWFVSFLSSDQISELCQTIKHSSLELHPEVEGFFFLGCRHRRSRLRPAISPAALREKSLFFHLKMSSSKCLFFHLKMSFEVAFVLRSTSCKRHFLRDAQSEYEKQTAISWPIRLEKQFRLED